MTQLPSSAVLAVIPARLGSERLARKPLHRLAGRPLIEWVWRRVRTFGWLDRVVVATDSDEVAEVCGALGAEVVMTSSSHRSGTERVAEVARLLGSAGFGVVLNVQGDEPFVSGDAVAAAVEQVRSGFAIGTAAAPLESAAAWRDPGVVKVVLGAAGAALYFSRAPVPHARDAEPRLPDAGGCYLRHVGVYAYTPEALARWVALPEHPLERVERLEQLRPLAAGMQIGVGRIAAADGGIDTLADADAAEQRLRALADTGAFNLT